MEVNGEGATVGSLLGDTLGDKLGPDGKAVGMDVTAGEPRTRQSNTIQEISSKKQEESTYLQILCNSLCNNNTIHILAPTCKSGTQNSPEL